MLGDVEGGGGGEREREREERKRERERVLKLELLVLEINIEIFNYVYFYKWRAEFFASLLVCSENLGILVSYLYKLLSLFVWNVAQQIALRGQ